MENKLSPVEQFYHDLQNEPVQKVKRGRRGSNEYFTDLTQRAIIAYNKETNPVLRDKIYKEFIDYAFNKLVENIYHTYFKSNYFDVPYDDIKCEVVAFLIEKIDRFTEEKGKAFSYFTRIVLNYLIILNNACYTKLKQRVETTVIDDDRDLNLELHSESFTDGLRDFINQWVEWFDENLDKIFTNTRDKIVADAVLEIFRTRDNIENFNKKSLYILIRERTGLKTQNITRVLNIMKDYFERMYLRYQKTGRITQYI